MPLRFAEPADIQMLGGIGKPPFTRRLGDEDFHLRRFAALGWAA